MQEEGGDDVSLCIGGGTFARLHVFQIALESMIDSCEDCEGVLSPL